MTLSQEQVLNNRYRIVKLLGQGGFGAVYQALDLTLNVACAVKESFEFSEEGQRQFLREAQILAGLRHPNLPRVSDFFALPEKGLYLVMDFVEGMDLEELRVNAGGMLPESQALAWVSQVCDALSYLHRQKPPVIHRDIKPANIKIAPPDEDYPHGRAMLVDFGVAKVLDTQMMTTIGARAYTPGFAPSEQYGQGVSGTDARTDIYALAATLYTLLTGHRPPESIKRLLHDSLVMPRQLNPGISSQTETAILKALQNDPDDRYQSMGEFKRAITAQTSPFEGSVHVADSQVTLISGPPTQDSIPAASSSVHPQVTTPSSPRPDSSPRKTGAGFEVVQTRPTPPVARIIPWKWIGFGVAGLALLAILGFGSALAMNGIRDNRLTQTSQARASQTAAALAGGPADILTPDQSPIAPASTFTPSPLPPGLTPTPSPLPPTFTPSPTPAAVLGPGSTQISPVDGMVQVYIPAGTFEMGFENGTRDERPVHTVRLDSFWMDQTEVTNAMFAAFLNENGNQTEGGVTWLNPAGAVEVIQSAGVWVAVSGRENHPVVEMSWYGAGAYCNWAGRQLPTEAQWEYAARGGLVGATYPWGEEVDCTRANYLGCVGDNTEVGSYPANGYGLYDMAGNVYEWISDWFGPYSEGEVENPSGPDSGEYRVLRGGSRQNGGTAMRVSLRSLLRPFRADEVYGFRCAASP